MKLGNLSEIWEAEIYYDELRWSHDNPLDEMDLENLESLQDDINETIDFLSGWQNRRLREENIKGVKRVKRKLIDFQLNIVHLKQLQENRKKHFERVNNVWNAKPKKSTGTILNYGLRGLLKATPFYRSIPNRFNPIPKGEVQS